MVARRVIGGVQSHFATRLPEWLLACEMAAESGQLLRTGRTLESTHAYAVLATMVEEQLWGWIGVVMAGVWLVALFLNGTFAAFRRVSPWVRSIAALCCALDWGVWTIAMYQGNPIGTGFINHIGYSALAAAYSIMIAHEIGRADKEAKWRSRSRAKTG